MPLDQIKEEILKNGFWKQDDARISEKMEEIIRSNYHTITEQGLSLLKLAVLKNELVSGIIRSFFPRSTLVLYKTMGKTKHKHAILGRTDDMRMLLVFCWSSESAGTIWSGSHLRQLELAQAANGLLMVSSDASLNQESIRPHSITLDRGGLAIVDARCAWKVEKGKAAILAFATPDEAQSWVRTTLPMALKPTVTDMVEETMDMHVSFGDTI
ncbi:Hypothetical protein NCS54_01370800 [Fusarium falciforme]|uniref:Hypothetical protein n=1 Tax=Fusarium falciforme TaxID=195108 RepID=UPI0023007317|nr:Hypothetical protein NCS54_01370800 [Fusarium falciforme]WAO96049.1 Hypothetical protein NCS54_01370800 [Fusarium falciforme]